MKGNEKEMGDKSSVKNRPNRKPSQAEIGKEMGRITTKNAENGKEMGMNKQKMARKWGG